MKQKLINAALFGIAAVVAAMQASGIPNTKQGWLGLGGVFVAAAWAKLSAADAVFSTKREVWTPERRAAEGGK